MESKQVIVMRKDLGMSRGKLVAQGAHASLAIILNAMNDSITPPWPGEENIKIKELHYETDGAFDKWINGPFTKVVLKVDSEEELLELYDKIKEANILVSLIKDAGRTELGKPTYTCIGVGPDYEEKINEFTGHLPLYK